MHFEILVEGQTELTALSCMMSKILCEYGKPHTWKIHKHQGIGTLPEDLNSTPRINNRTLLHNLPSKLRAYGNSMGDEEVVVLLVDLDDRESGFKNLISSGKRSPRVLETKRKWAATIAPEMDIENNRSPSFCCFRDGIRREVGR